MAVLFSILLIIFAFMSIKKTKKIVNPVTVLYFLWALIFFLSSIRLFDLRATSSYIYIILFLGLISFGIGFYFNFFKRNKKNINLSSNYKFNINYNIIYILSFISIAYFCTKLPYIINNLLNGGGLASIRSMAQDSSSMLNYNSPIINAIRILIVFPFSMAIIPISAADYWIGNKNKKVFILCIIIVILRVITEGGRILILYFILHMLISYFYSKNKKLKIRKKSKNKIIFLAIIFVLITSLSRSQGRLIKDSYYYFSMEPYMFEVWKDNVDNEKLMGYGESSLNGFIFPLVYIAKNTLSIPFPSHWNSIYNKIAETDSSWQIIAGEMSIWILE